MNRSSFFFVVFCSFMIEIHNDFCFTHIRHIQPRFRLSSSDYAVQQMFPSKVQGGGNRKNKSKGFCAREFRTFMQDLVM